MWFQHLNGHQVHDQLMYFHFCNTIPTHNTSVSQVLRQWLPADDEGRSRQPRGRGVELSHLYQGERCHTPGFHVLQGLGILGLGFLVSCALGFLGKY